MTATIDSSHCLTAGAELDPRVMTKIRRQTALHGCKWDTQVGDVTTLAPFPLIIKQSEWQRLASWAEQLAAEAAIAETEIANNPDLLHELGFPRALENILASHDPLTPAAGRVIRFDFHFTTEGWRISEANSDVPGGYTEGSFFTDLMAEHFPEYKCLPNPGSLWSKALAQTAGPGGTVALLSAPGYMEDHQVTSYLAAQLRQHVCTAHLCKPQQLRWTNGQAHLKTNWHEGPVDAIFRFYQAEWLARLAPSTEWQFFFRNGKTPVANPPLAPITENKRFPLICDELKADLSTWRTLLPETRDPREVDLTDDNWLLKTAMCNTGDTVSIRASMRPMAWRQARWSARLFPKKWLAQRRFESVPLQTPCGPRHVCVGVYTVNGRAAGAYARMSPKPVIDFEAVDVALLIDDNE